MSSATEDRKPAGAASENVIPLPRQRWWTRWRYAALFVVILVSVTTYWSHRKSVRSQAEVDFIHHLEKGKAAWQAGDYYRAAEELEQALQAADILGREDTTVRQARQMWRECRAMSDLASQPLFAILAEGQRLWRTSPAAWRHVFQKKYADRWLIFDTTVRRHRPDESDEPEILIDYPLLLDEAPVLLDGDLPAVWELSPTEKPQRMVLAVQLKSCERQTGSKRGWIVRFHDSAFLWSDYETLRRLGWAPTSAPQAKPSVKSSGEQQGDHSGRNREEELRNILKRQRRLLGLTEHERKAEHRAKEAED